jgi:hypothetical protein
MLRKYFNEVDERIILMGNNLDAKVLLRIKQSFDNEDKYYELINSSPITPQFSLLKREISRLSNFLSSR